MSQPPEEDHQANEYNANSARQPILSPPQCEEQTDA